MSLVLLLIVLSGVFPVNFLFGCVRGVQSICGCSSWFAFKSPSWCFFAASSLLRGRESDSGCQDWVLLHLDRQWRLVDTCAGVRLTMLLRVQTLFAGNRNLCAALSFVLRTSNTFLGSLMWVDFIRLLGLQPKNDAPTADAKSGKKKDRKKDKK